MLRKALLLIISALTLVSFSSCNERDVLAGAAAGAIIVATTHGGHHGHYRHGNHRYYHNRGVYYRRHYRTVYGPRRYNGDRYRRGYYGNAGRRHYKSLNNNLKVKKFAKFYAMPMAAAEILVDAQERAKERDFSGLSAIGLFSKDFKNLASMKAPSNGLLYRMSLRTGLSERHLFDFLIDYQKELKANL